MGLARDAAVALVEATTPGDDATPLEQRIHLTPRQAGEFATQARVRTLVLTHLWSERNDSQTRQEAAAVFSGRTEIARPGLTVDAENAATWFSVGHVARRGAHRLTVILFDELAPACVDVRGGAPGHASDSTCLRRGG